MPKPKPKPERRGKALEEKVSFYKRNVRENVGSKKKESEKGREKEIFIRRENLEKGSRVAAEQTAVIEVENWMVWVGVLESILGIDFE